MRSRDAREGKEGGGLSSTLFMPQWGINGALRVLGHAPPPCGRVLERHQSPLHFSGLRSGKMLRHNVLVYKEDGRLLRSEWLTWQAALHEAGCRPPGSR